MSLPTREQIMIALFTLLQGAYSFAYTSRRPVTQANLPSLQTPALLLLDDDEQHKREKKITPAIRTITCAAWIFVNAANDPSSVPATILNNILDAIDPTQNGALKPGLNGLQTLGGLVTDCWIEGKVTKDPGILTGNGFMHIPMSILLP